MKIDGRQRRLQEVIEGFHWEFDLHNPSLRLDGGLPTVLINVRQNNTTWESLAAPNVELTR